MSTARRLQAVPDRPLFGIAVRVSRVGGRSGERFLSPEIQISSSRKAVEHMGGHVDTTVGDQGVFYDLDVSGAVAPSDRPGLGEALELVRAGRLHGVALYDLSRWSRETTSGLRELEEVAKAGGQVLSASEAIDLDTPTGVFSTTVQLAAHQLRRQQASEAWKATHARRFEMGLPHGKLPYGYVNEAGGAVPDSILGAAVARAFAEYAAAAVTQKDLALRLGGLRGKPMRQGVVSQLLRNRFYLGELELLGGTRPGRHQPLIDEVTFAAVQRRLNFERDAGPHWRSPASPVIGVVHCAVCQGPLYRQGTGSRGGQPRPARLYCSGTIAKTCVGIGTPLLDEVVLAVRDLALAEAALLTDDAPTQIARRGKAVQARTELDRLEKEQTDLLNAIGRLVAAHAKSPSTVAGDRAHAAGLAELQRELEVVEARLLQVQGAEVSVTRPLKELRSTAERIRTMWGSYTPLEQRAQLMVFVPRVLVRRAGYRGEEMADRLFLPDDEGVPT